MYVHVSKILQIHDIRPSLSPFRVVYIFCHIISDGSGASETAMRPASCMCTTCLAVVAAVKVLNVTNALDKNILRSSGGLIRDASSSYIYLDHTMIRDTQP